MDRQWHGLRADVRCLTQDRHPVWSLGRTFSRFVERKQIESGKTKSAPPCVHQSRVISLAAAKRQPHMRTKAASAELQTRSRPCAFIIALRSRFLSFLTHLGIDCPAFKYRPSSTIPPTSSFPSTSIAQHVSSTRRNTCYQWP